MIVRFATFRGLPRKTPRPERIKDQGYHTVNTIFAKIRPTRNRFHVDVHGSSVRLAFINFSVIITFWISNLSEALAVPGPPYEERTSTYCGGCGTESIAGRRTIPPETGS